MRDWLAANRLPAILAGAGVMVGLMAASLFLPKPAQAPIQVYPREVLPTPTVMLYVHVDGAVIAPGVYALASGARVFEAIEAAGGASEVAEQRELNLAAKVADGQKLVIPARASAPLDAAGPEPPASAPSAGRSAAAAPSAAKINVNTASRRILESLPGIGPVTAKRVVDHREANGHFARIEQLRELRIVNATTFERIKDLVSVD